MQFYVIRYLYLSKLVTLPGASGAFLRLLLDQVISCLFIYNIFSVWFGLPLLINFYSCYGVSFLPLRLLLKNGFIYIAVLLCTHLYWNFSLYIDHIGRKAFRSCPKASTGLWSYILWSFLFSCSVISWELGLLVFCTFIHTFILTEGKLFQEWFSSVLANWKLWIPFQFLNFRFVPQQFQVCKYDLSKVHTIWYVHIVESLIHTFLRRVRSYCPSSSPSDHLSLWVMLGNELGPGQANITALGFRCCLEVHEKWRKSSNVDVLA